MSIIRRALSASQQRSGNNTVPIPSNADLGRMALSGVNVNDKSAMGLPVFYRCVSVLTTSIATLPLKVYTTTDGVRREITPQPSIIASPFSQATLIEGLDQIMQSLLLRGNAFAGVTQFDALGRPSELYVLSPDVVKVTRDPTTGSVVYTVNGTPYDDTQIVHIKNMVRPGDVVGLNPIDHWRSFLGIGMAADEYAARYYSQGALQSGFISLSDNSSADDARLIGETFKSRHTGLANAHSPAVFSGGAQWVPTSVTPDQAQFLESRQYSDSTIATVMGVPPHMLGMTDKTTSWGTGIEVQGRSFVDYTLRNYLVRIEKALSDLLPANTWVEFDTDALTRADTATRYANYAVALMNGFMCADEVRAAEGDGPIPGGLGAVFRGLATVMPLTAIAPEPNDQTLPLLDPENPGAGPAIAPDDAPPAIAS